MSKGVAQITMLAMTTTDYLIDSLLVLLVLLQIKERTLTTKTLVRPLVIVGIAVANYLHGIPTAGNDLVLIAILALVGTSIGLASAQTVLMRRRSRRRCPRPRRLGLRVLLGARDGLAVRLHLLDHPHRRLLDRALQRPARHHRKRLDGRAARDGAVRSGLPLGADGDPPSAAAGRPCPAARLTPLPSPAVILTRFSGRRAFVIRLIGLALISWTVLTATHHAPGESGRALVISVLFALCVVAWLTWTSRPFPESGVTPEVWVLAAAGGVLCGASPNSAASAFVFIAVVAAAVRTELSRAFIVVGVGILALAVSVLLYHGSALGLLAYSLGFAAATLAGANARQAAAKTEQAELLLAQTQRSHEEQLRAARLEESTRIAREIHDVLAHALAGLTIQLEATSALVEQGADPRRSRPAWTAPTRWRARGCARRAARSAPCAANLSPPRPGSRRSSRSTGAPTGRPS